MTPELPHANAPFKLTRTGTETVEQGSNAHIRAMVYNTAVCPEGFRDDLPEFGVPQLVWRNEPLPLAPLEEALNRWVPEADLELEQVRSALAEVQVIIAADNE